MIDCTKFLQHGLEAVITDVTEQMESCEKEFAKNLGVFRSIRNFAAPYSKEEIQDRVRDEDEGYRDLEATLDCCRKELDNIQVYKHKAVARIPEVVIEVVTGYLKNIDKPDCLACDLFKDCTGEKNFERHEPNHPPCRAKVKESLRSSRKSG